MGNFWIPNFKWQYVEWFISQGILTKSQANRMTFDQLRGKYYEVRRSK